MTEPPLDANDRVDAYARADLSPLQARELALQALESDGLFDELTSVALVRAALDTSLAKEKLSLGEALDAYFNNRPEASEERTLAQAALHHEDVFDVLTAQGVVEAGLKDEAVRRRISAPPARVRSLTTRAVAIGTIAAGIAVLSVFLARPFFLKRDRPIASVAPPAESTAAPPLRVLQPSLDASAGEGHPILLASQLQPSRAAGAPVFRGATSADRLPRAKGSILSVDQNLATIDLGSLDGLAKGSELGVFRNSASVQPVGRLVVTSVFREQARGRIVSGKTVQVHDEVRANGALHLAALLQQAEAMRDRGDLVAAREVARRALAWAESARVDPEKRSQALEALAAVDYQAGDLDAALEHLQVAVDGSPDKAITLNSLGVLYSVRGNYPRAQTLLLQAAANAGADASLRAQIHNNLGVLAELRGDSRHAAEYYQDALNLPSASDRRTIEANLARLKAAH